MDNLDKIVEFLRYHPGVSRPELMARLDLGVGDTQVKKLLAAGLSRGDPAHAKALVEAYEKGYREIEASGELRRIREYYVR